MTTWTPTAADRDADGKIKLTTETPRSLADLLPPSVAAGETPAGARPAPARRVQFALAGAAGLLLVFALSYLIGARSPVAPPPPPPAPAPSPVASPPAPSPAPVAPAVVAFAAPDGDVLGPVAAAQAYHFTGRYGDGWVQADVPGSGRVWVRRADLRLDQDDLTAIAALPDLAPPPTSIPAPQIQAAAPAPTIEPQVCIKTDYGERCGPASQMQDQQQIASEIATASKEYSQAWLAAKTAEAQK